MRKTCKRLQSRYQPLAPVPLYDLSTYVVPHPVPCARFGYVVSTAVPCDLISWTWYRRGVIYATMHSLFVQLRYSWLVSSPLPSHKHGLKWYGVPECATYIPPNRLPTPCSTAHKQHHLDTVAKAPPLCYHIHTSGASGTDAGTSWVDRAAGERQ